MHASRPLPRDAGLALMAAFMFAIVILALTVSILASGEALRRQNRAFIAAQRAHAAAESGVQFVVARLASDLGDLLTSGADFDEVLRGAGVSATRFAVSVVPALNDGTDNDLDGLIDEADEGDILELTSTGYCDQVAKTVRATLVPRYRVPWLTGAVYIGDPTANVTLSGNALLISGTKVSLAGLPTGGAGTGIGVAGDPGFVRDQIAPGVLDNIVGQPKVGEVEYYDLQLLVEQGAKAANVRLVDGETSMPDSPGAWGTLLAPAVVYGAGDIKIAGGAGGVGLLVVDGHLEITGGFDWQGLVIVRGGVTLSGGGGGKRIIGALVVDDAVRTEESDDPASASVDGTGTIDILFSPDGLQLVRDSFTTTYMLTNWREGPNPDVAAETTP